MKMVVLNANIKDEVTTAAIQHGGEEIVNNIALFDRVTYDGRYDLFQHINQYWASLPENQQQEIFNIYKDIKVVYDEMKDVKSLDDKLYPLVNKLIMMHNLTHIEFWVKFNSDICIPQDIEKDYIESDANSNTRAKTYVQKDYRDLVVMTMVFRTLIPVWGEYIFATKSEYGTEYKEYYAFKLITSSVLDNCQAMNKLRLYVTNNIPSEKERSKATAIIGGISTEELPEWLLSLVVVRKLSAGDLRGVDKDGHLISSAYNYIFNKLKTLENSFAGNIRTKIPEDKTTDDNKASLLEGYRFKNNVKGDDIEATDYFINEPKVVGVPQLAKFIIPDIPDRLINESIISASVLYQKPINTGQRILAQWLINDVVYGKMLGLTDHVTTVRAIATAQALLWHRGHFELAAFVSATEFVQDNKILSMLGSDSRARIPKEDVEVLDRLFPFSRKPGGKKKTFNKINPAVQNIELLANLLSKKDWVITLPESWMKEAAHIFGGRRKIGVPHDIRPLLSKLAIQIAKGEF